MTKTGADIMYPTRHFNILEPQDLTNDVSGPHEIRLSPNLEVPKFWNVLYSIQMTSPWSTGFEIWNMFLCSVGSLLAGVFCNRFAKRALSSYITLGGTNSDRTLHIFSIKKTANQWILRCSEMLDLKVLKLWNVRSGCLGCHFFKQWLVLALLDTFNCLQAVTDSCSSNFPFVIYRHICRMFELSVKTRQLTLWQGNLRLPREEWRGNQT